MTVTPTPTPAPPETLREALADRYQLQREIGRGGMATVYLATDVKHRREVAVKVLKPDLAASLGADRFLQEIEIAAQLNHPHILPLLDSADLDGTLLYVMPFVEGESLRGLLEREGALPFDRVLGIVKEVASALTYAHRHGVVHRDIKPENILLSDGHAVVADFGIAKAISSIGGRELTRTGFPIGTPGYMSPEQAAGIADLDERSDVFSLGCVVYEMLVGDTPRFWLSEEAVRLGRLMDAPAKHRSRLDALPRTVERALVGALVLKPQDRLASPTEFVDALQERSSGARRRYSDTEVQDIVKRASEEEAKPTDHGMTIGGVQALGTEVGIAPAQVAKAARALDPVEFPGLETLLGGPFSYHMTYELDGRVEPGEQMELLNVIRKVMRQHGRASEVMGSLEWRGHGVEKDHVTVTITPRSNHVGVTVIADRSTGTAVVYILSLMGSVFGAIILGETGVLGFSGTLAVVVTLATAATAGLVLARTAIAASGKALKRRLDRLRAELRRHIEGDEGGGQ